MMFQNMSLRYRATDKRMLSLMGLQLNGDLGNVKYFVSENLVASALLAIGGALFVA